MRRGVLVWGLVGVVACGSDTAGNPDGSTGNDAGGDAATTPDGDVPPDAGPIVAPQPLSPNIVVDQFGYRPGRREDRRLCVAR